MRMKQQFHNELELTQALSFFKSDPYEAKSRMEEYIKKYPRSYSDYPFYAGILIALRELEQAEKFLDDVSKLVSNDNYYKNNITLYKLYQRRYNIAKIRLLLYKGEYQELYDNYVKPNTYICNVEKYDLDLLTDNQNIGSNINMQQVKFYCRKKLGLINSNFRNNKSYLVRQIIKYDFNDFLRHIQKHMVDFNVDKDKPNDNLFVSGFPIMEVIDEVKKYIPNDNALYVGLSSDRYVFKYTGCGRVNNKLVDYIHVICFHGTDEIITMCPSIEGEYLPHIDLDYMNNTQKSDDIKVKRRSQIDKFNQRFGIK